jgi:hypothetical protein
VVRALGALQYVGVESFLLYIKEICSPYSHLLCLDNKAVRLRKFLTQYQLYTA